MSLGYTMVTLRSETLLCINTSYTMYDAPKKGKKIRISRGLGGRRDEAQTNADVILRFLF